MVIQRRIPGARSVGLWTVIVLALSGCRPDIEGRPSLIDSPSVIAIRSTPPEAKAEGDVTYEVLLAQPIDDTTTPAFNWAMCLARKPLATPGPIADSCLASSGPDLQELGTLPGAVASIPKDACQLFGPTPPSQNEPAIRPVDPDTTGGYYQPVRLLTQYSLSHSQYEVGVTRIYCESLASGATQDQSIRFAKDYRLNQNPRIDQITFMRASGESTVIDANAPGAAVTVTSGEKVNIGVSWPICPLLPNCGDNICSSGEDLTNCPSDCQNPQGCEGSEPYLSYDTVSQSLTERRESIRISWYATDGSFNHDRTGRSETEADQANTSNDWTAPDKTTTVRFWLVIRDDRRGVNWTKFDLEVTK